MDSFRNYNDISLNIRNTYKKARQYQNLEFYYKMKNEYDNRNKQLITIWDAIHLLDKFVDQSDPDIELPNIQHLFQSVEAARNNDQPEWLQFTCLIHDLGKIMYLYGNDEIKRMESHKKYEHKKYGRITEENGGIVEGKYE